MIAPARPQSNGVHRYLNIEPGFSSKLTTRRYFTNARPEFPMKTSSTYKRVPLSELAKPKIFRPSRPDSKPQQAFQGLCRSIPSELLKSIGKHGKCTENSKNLRVFNNESLVIESLSATPKVKHLSPIGEKLIRLFKSTKKQEKAFYHCVIPLNISGLLPKEERETPSPIIKPKYIHC